jgi:outer membrane beta-barrel protein
MMERRGGFMGHGIRCLQLSVATLVVLSSTSLLAQSGKYKRNEKKAAAEPAAGASTTTAVTSTTGTTQSGAVKPSAGAAAPANGTQVPGGPSDKSDKVDISELEQRYWAPKDQEFSVVQNRLYQKAKRPYITVGWGPVINDTYSTGSVVGGSVGYYFTEKMGVELTYHAADAKKNTLVQGFISQFQTSPDHNLLKDFVGLSYVFTPIYAKLSFMDTRIVHFDMSISPGIGMTRYEQQLNDRTLSPTSTPTFSLDITQQFFLTGNLALRFDVRNRFYREELLKWKGSGLTVPTGTVLRTETTTNTIVVFGLTYFF